MHRRRLIAGVAAIGALLAGRAVADTPTVAPELCLPVADQTLAWIADTMPVPGHRVTGPAVAYRAPGFEKVWFVAAYADGKPAVWAINTITEDHGVTLSVTDGAKAATGWFHADTSAAKITDKEPGVAEAMACLAGIATPVASPLATPAH